MDIDERLRMLAKRQDALLRRIKQFSQSMRPRGESQHYMAGAREVDTQNIRALLRIAQRRLTDLEGQ